MNVKLLTFYVVAIVLASGCTPTPSSPKNQQAQAPKPASLVSLDASGIAKEVYDAVAGHDRATVPQKNSILFSLKSVLVGDYGVIDERNTAISELVKNNGDFIDLADAIIAAANLAYPFKAQNPPPPPKSPVKLVAKPATMAENVYELITLWAGVGSFVDEKNDVIPKVDAAINGPAMARDKAITKAVNPHQGLRGLEHSIIALLTGKNAPPSVLRSKPATMEQVVYDEIANHGGAAKHIDIKNTVIGEIDAAINGPIASRDKIINETLKLYNEFNGLAQKIIAHLNMGGGGAPGGMGGGVGGGAPAGGMGGGVGGGAPAGGMGGGVGGGGAPAGGMGGGGAPVALKTQAESGLPKDVYDVIKDHANGTNAEKNNIIKGIVAAMYGTRLRIPALRSLEIQEAVNNSGIAGGTLGQDIKNAVDKADPIGPKAHRDFLKHLRDYSALPTVKKMVKTPGLTEETEVSELKEPEISTWRNKARTLIANHVAAYGEADYREWLVDFATISKDLGRSEQALQTEFENVGLKFFKAAIVAEAAVDKNVTKQRLQEFSDALLDFAKKPDARVEVYEKFDQLLKAYNNKVVQAKRGDLENLIKAKVSVSAIGADLLDRLAAAQLPFSKVGKITDELDALFAKFVGGTDWHLTANPLLQKLTDLGAASLVTRYRNQFTAKETAGPDQELADIKQDFDDFEAAFARGLAKFDYKEFLGAVNALKRQKEVIDAFKGSKPFTWQMAQRGSLAKRREIFASKYLEYWVAQIEKLDKVLADLQAATSQAFIVNQAEQAVTNYFNYDPLKNREVLVEDLRNEFVNPNFAKVEIDALKAKIANLQTSINNHLVNLLKKVTNAKIQPKMNSTIDKAKLIKERLNLP